MYSNYDESHKLKIMNMHTFDNKSGHAAGAIYIFHPALSDQSLSCDCALI